MDITNHLPLFFPVLVRVSGLFLFMPFFNGKTIPMRAKVGVSLGLAVLVFSSRAWDIVLPETELAYVFLLVREGIVGFSLGLALAALFAGVQAAGQLVGYQMGFSLVSSYDPDFGQLEIIGQIKFLLTMLVFLLLNGHLRLIEVMAKSYDVIPIGEALFTAGLVQKMISSVGYVLNVALLLGAPVVITLWMTSAFLAVLNRVVPQMNIFMVDFPLKIAVGMMTLSLSLPFVVETFKIYFRRFFADVPMMLLMIKG